MRRSPRFMQLRLLALLAPAAFTGSAAFAQLPAGQVFADVPVTAPWYNATYTLHQLGISVGCTPLPAPSFCPTGSLVRQDMAVFIVTAWSARVWNDPTAFLANAPPSANPYFSDVSPSSGQFPFIQKLYELGVTAGTVAPQLNASGQLVAQGQFSPGGTLTNYQIAVFATVAGALAASGCNAPYFAPSTPKPFPVSTSLSCAPGDFGSGPSQNPYFSDVVSGNNYFKFVQQLGDSGGFAAPSPIAGSPGCPNCVFGGNNTVTRGQMAIWTVVGMGLLPESVLSINAPGYPGGPNGYAVPPTITVAFTFTLYNQGPASIEYGQFLLSNTSGDTIQNTYCSGAWATAALKLYDPPVTQSATGYNQPLGDSFCTVSLVSVTPITNGLQATVNFTFNPSAAGVTYNVFHDVIYTEGVEPWENVGTLQVLSPQPLNPAPTVTLTDTTQSSGDYFAGDSYTVTVTGPPGQPVSEIINGIDYGIRGFTNASGVSLFSGTWSAANVGTYAEVWYVDGVQAGSVQFSVDPQSTPDPAPLPYPNVLDPPPTPPTPQCNVTGAWTDSFDSPGPETWYLVQPGSTVSGTLVVANGIGSSTWTLSGNIASNVVTLTASNPSPATNYSGLPVAASVVAVITLSSGCTTGASSEVATYPSGSTGYSQGPKDMLLNLPVANQTQFAGNGVLTLTTARVTFSVSPAPYLYLSTGDTNTKLTTTASNSQVVMSNVTYAFTAPTNPTVNGVSVSNCSIGQPSTQFGSGTGSASSVVTVSPVGCSGVSTGYGVVNGTTTNNITQIVVPPQVLLQVMAGEAHSVGVAYPNGPDEQALGVAIRNRLGDPLFSPNYATYQGLITSAQFNGIDSSVTTGQTPELANAGAVFAGTSTVSVANAKCFFSPNPAGWTAIQTALASGTTVLPTVNANPGCYRTPSGKTGNEQFVVKQSMSTTTIPANQPAPSFVFVQYRVPTSPAVIQIP